MTTYDLPPVAPPLCQLYPGGHSIPLLYVRPALVRAVPLAHLAPLGSLASAAAPLVPAERVHASTKPARARVLVGVHVYLKVCTCTCGCACVLVGVHVRICGCAFSVCACVCAFMSCGDAQLRESVQWCVRVYGCAFPRVEIFVHAGMPGCAFACVCALVHACVRTCVRVCAHASPRGLR